MPAPATHLRAPLLWLLVPLMSGLAAARLWPAPASGLSPILLSAGLAGIAAIACASRGGRIAALAWAILITVAGGLSGFALLHGRHPDLPDEKTRPPREAAVTIQVRQVFPPAPTARQVSGLAEIVAAGPHDAELTGRLIYFSAIRRISVSPRRSGTYSIRGVLEPVPRDETGGSFNDYLTNLGIRHRLVRAHMAAETAPPGIFAAFCTRTQDRLEHILRRGLERHPDIASLYLAMLLGEKAVLSADQENAYMRSGTFHIFSISGLHVGVIALALYTTAGLLRLPPRWSPLGALLILWLYVQITGASTPAMRAFIMAAFLTLSRSFRLPGNPLAALAAAALVTLLWDPVQLFSTGFQMSYAVVVALVAMGRPLADRWAAAWKPFALLPRSDWHWHHRRIDTWGRNLVMAIAGCWTAFLASTPSGIGYFELFSTVSLLANLVIIPLSMAIMWAGFVSLVLGLPGLWPVSVACNLVAAVVVVATDWLLREGTSLPATWFNARYRADCLAPLSMVLMTAVFLTGSALKWKSRFGGFWLPVVALALLIILGVKFGGS